ncbi:zeta toxin [mine drainage metagenome]|uniref:Zeta toxin n=1 Tax=mine drainage metagenome TaxID=410659 RepID=A0A1J5QTB2_9ZZZZ
MPQIWFIGGPNGAGKTTMANRWLADRIPIISPDSISALHGVGPVQAGKMAIKEQERLLAENASFGIDTTFSGKREIDLMLRAKEAGYKVNLVFVCVADAMICKFRINERVANNGHAVPSEDVARRYDRSLSNLTIAFDIAERVFVFDNTRASRKLILSIENGRVKHLSNNIPEWARQAIPNSIIASRRELGR